MLSVGVLEIEIAIGCDSVKMMLGVLVNFENLRFAVKLMLGVSILEVEVGCDTV